VLGVFSSHDSDMYVCMHVCMYVKGNVKLKFVLEQATKANQ
jgi:hypothetical protein